MKLRRRGVLIAKPETRKRVVPLESCCWSCCQVSHSSRKAASKQMWR